jgi:hypothetical protein
MPRLFALDKNFPEPIVSVLSDFQADAQLVPLDRIDARMSTLDDWELLLALHHHSDAWDGLITTDSSMLAQGRELATLVQTKLTLVVAVASGHNPVKASGLLFAYLAGICQRTTPERAQLWRLSQFVRCVRCVRKPGCIGRSGRGRTYMSWANKVEGLVGSFPVVVRVHSGALCRRALIAHLVDAHERRAGRGCLLRKRAQRSCRKHCQRQER